MNQFIFAVLVILVALIFDFINGWHDASNSIATVVATRVLRPFTAVIWAAFFNFVAFLLFGTHVAQTIGADLVNISLIPKEWQLWTLLCGLIGAIVWDVFTWYFGLPTSSSHALIGGYAGAAIAAYRGISGLLKPAAWTKTLLFIVLSPIIGMMLGSAIRVALYWILRKRTPKQVDRDFRASQLVSAALYSLGHGGNDAQKTMGIIAGVLVAAGFSQTATRAIPLWVVLACHAAMGLGTLTGGWRIVHTLGGRLTKLKPVDGFSAETAGAATLFMATNLGIPVSTTHTITGAIVGVGAIRRRSAVRWALAQRVVWAWFLTIPMAAFFAAICFLMVTSLSH